MVYKLTLCVQVLIVVVLSVLAFFAITSTPEQQAAHSSGRGRTSGIPLPLLGWTFAVFAAIVLTAVMTHLLKNKRSQ
jgi:hypothetical protein